MMDIKNAAEAAHLAQKLKALDEGVSIELSSMFCVAGDCSRTVIAYIEPCGYPAATEFIRAYRADIVAKLKALGVSVEAP